MLTVVWTPSLEPRLERLNLRRLIEIEIEIENSNLQMEMRLIPEMSIILEMSIISELNLGAVEPAVQRLTTVWDLTCRTEKSMSSFAA